MPLASYEGDLALLASCVQCAPSLMGLRGLYSSLWWVALSILFLLLHWFVLVNSKLGMFLVVERKRTRSGRAVPRARRGGGVSAAAGAEVGDRDLRSAFPSCLQNVGGKGFYKVKVHREQETKGKKKEFMYVGHKQRRCPHQPWPSVPSTGLSTCPLVQAATWMQPQALAAEAHPGTP